MRRACDALLVLTAAGLLLWLVAGLTAGFR